MKEPMPSKSLQMKGRRGQVMTEFAVMAAMVLFICFAWVLFLSIFSQWSWRVLKLIGLELP